MSDRKPFSYRVDEDPTWQDREDEAPLEPVRLLRRPPEWTYTPLTRPFDRRSWR